MYYTPEITIRFWSKAILTANDDLCWIWQRGKDKFGYGRFKFGESTQYANRIAWQLTYGEIPSGLKVLHTCDNPSCINPKHLFLGTTLDNNRDRAIKGRNAWGEKNGNHKFTVEQVRYIRQRYAQGGISVRELGREVGMSKAQVSKIINRNCWNDLD